MLNYYINDDGVLSLYYNNFIICEIEDCADMSQKEISSLIQELYNESFFKKQIEKEV